MTDVECLFFWGSHGCSLPKGHTGFHICAVDFYNDDDDETVCTVFCCQYDPEADPERRVRHNYGEDDGPTEWGTWGPYGEGWWMT